MGVSFIKMKLSIISNKKIAYKTYQMELKGKFNLNPGQFINIKINNSNELFLRRPISVCDVNGERLTIIYKVFGKGTELLSKKTTGQQLDCLLNLGNGFEIVNRQNIVLIGGGVGVPPLYYLAKKLKEEGRKVTVVLGFNSKEEIFLAEEFKQYGDVHISTVDGSYGTSGTVLNILENLTFDYYYTCGPELMLKALATKYPKDGQLSFEERMGCGFGACMGCSCKTLTGYKRICVEGPVMKVEEIIHE